MPRIDTNSMHYAEGRVDVGRHQLRYVQAGEGNPLVWLHGGGGLHLTAATDLLVRSLRLVAFELPGFGARSHGEILRSFDKLSERIATGIEALGLYGYVLHGTSFGGTAALYLALNHPDRVSRLILESLADFRPPGWTPPDLEALRRGLFLHPERARSVKIDPAVQRREREFVNQLSLTVDPKALSARLRHLRVPMQVMFGDADWLTPPELARMYCDHAPYCSPVLIRDAAHVISSDQPEAYATAVCEFAMAHGSINHRFGG
jgi:pimeloyl-ACP methyl ester carboxylesterase